MPTAPHDDALLKRDDLRLLVRLADPESQAPEGLQGDQARLARLLRSAVRHGVAPVVFRKLREARLVDEAASIFDPYRTRILAGAGQAMLLERMAQTIAARFAGTGIRAAIVKGPVFAERLYPTRGDRPFTDIDFLVAPDSIDAANATMEALGFVRPTKTWDNSDRDREYKWLDRENSSLLVELHGDLVHYPALRRRISFGYDQLAEAEHGIPNSAPALLMTAIIHAACGHKFHELGLLVDVLQAVRRLEGDDEGRVVTVCNAMGAALEMAVTLHLVGKLFEEPRARALAARVGDGWAIGLSYGLIDAEAVFGPDRGNSLGAWWRRHGFRLLQQIGPLRPRAGTMPQVRRPLSAVFLVAGNRLTDDMIRRWRAAGHRVAGIVMPRNRGPYHRLRRTAIAALAGTPVKTVLLPVDWEVLSNWIAPLAADVLISHAFPKLVPAELLSLFPNGGVNLHPALLPYYRGPQPFGCMVVDRAWREHGGMTLHVMTDRYDEGDILATVAFTPADWRSGASLRKAIMQSVSDLVLQAVPLHCRGTIRPRPQPPGEFPYAASAPRKLTIGRDWKVDDLAAAGAVMGRRSGLLVDAAGRCVPIGRWLARLSAPTGKPPVVRQFSVELDCSDGRVRVARGDRWGRIVDQIRRRLRPDVARRASPPVRYDTIAD